MHATAAENQRAEAETGSQRSDQAARRSGPAPACSGGCGHRAGAGGGARGQHRPAPQAAAASGSTASGSTASTVPPTSSDDEAQTRAAAIDSQNRAKLIGMVDPLRGDDSGANSAGSATPATSVDAGPKRLAA